MTITVVLGQVYFFPIGLQLLLLIHYSIEIGGDANDVIKHASPRRTSECHCQSQSPPNVTLSLSPCALYPLLPFLALMHLVNFLSYLWLCLPHASAPFSNLILRTPLMYLLMKSVMMQCSHSKDVFPVFQFLSFFYLFGMDVSAG